MKKYQNQQQINYFHFFLFIVFATGNVTLEFGELLLAAGRLGHLDDVEANGLAQWSALTNGHNISDIHIPTRQNRNILLALHTQQNPRLYTHTACSRKFSITCLQLKF